ncbi:hypothetical protein FGRMN_5191 [Fusarium graminum]|nr:hypothetical protein FGRMN_5191 [Fusarium graminum]
MRDGSYSAKPYQIIGAKWISDMVNSPLPAGILADERGVGRTLQIGLALSIHIQQVEKQINNRASKAIDSDRVHEPSITICPAIVKQQIIRDFKEFLGDCFKLELCTGIVAD